MAHERETATARPAVDGPVRLNWLRGMYVANVLVSGSIGLLALAAPALFRSLTGVPAGDPISYGIANGAVPLAFGVAGLLGLRAPLRLSPVLALQVGYKALFLAAVVVPLAMTSGVPSYAWPVVGIFVIFIVGNLVAIPFPYLLGRSPTAA